MGRSESGVGSWEFVVFSERKNPGTQVGVPVPREGADAELEWRGVLRG